VPKSPFAQFVPHLGRLGRATRWRRSRAGRPRIWAHRGDSAHAPENTMKAFERAADLGADGIELDVCFDGDRNVVVFHDDELERLTGERGRMDATPAATRAGLRVGGETIPLLAEVLQAIDLEINVEIKSNRTGRMGDLVAATAKVIKESGRADHILISSFDPFVLVQAHRHLPDVALAYLFHEQQPLLLRRGWAGRAAGASLFHPEHKLCTEQSVKAWHTAGLPVNTWTVDDAAELRRLANIGVDGVFTNDVANAVDVLGKL
jgi:glycerophosphoryl diester phosphodiesterase